MGRLLTQDQSLLGRCIQRKEDGMTVSQGPGIIITEVSIPGIVDIHLGDIVVPKRPVEACAYFRLSDVPDGTIGIVFKFDDPTKYRDFIYIRWIKDGMFVDIAASTANINDITVIESRCGM